MRMRRTVIVGYHAAELLEIASITTALQMANMEDVATPYEIRFATVGGRPITCGSALVIQAEAALERVTGPLDTLIVVGGTGYELAAADRVLVAHVRRLARESRRVASVCTGAAVLAAAGLLDGRRAATHWRMAGELAASYPAVTFDPVPIFIRDGAVTTAAGVTSALDLTLAFIEEDEGTDLARAVARNLVTYLQRPGNQAQMSMFTQAPPPEDALVRRVTAHIVADLPGDLSADALADAAGVSARHLSRLFLRHLGQTPARYVRHARTEAAAHLLASTRLPIGTVAARSGFGTVEALRLAFGDRYGTTPSRFRADNAASSRAKVPAAGG